MSSFSSARVYRAVFESEDVSSCFELFLRFWIPSDMGTLLPTLATLGIRYRLQIRRTFSAPDP